MHRATVARANFAMEKQQLARIARMVRAPKKEMVFFADITSKVFRKARSISVAP
jgi:hypothetical protein